MAENLNVSSRDDLDIDDIWYDEELLMDDHIAGVLDKWNQIDDEIWAKIILMEKNRRVAKAFVRSPLLTINGGDSGFDGEVVGLAGFDNTLRDSDSEKILQMVGDGCKLQMDEGGNVLIKRISRENIYCRNNTGTSNLKELEHDKPHKLFDMRKFQHNIAKEMRKENSDWDKVRQQAISSLAFVSSCTEVLDQPVWALVINIVALDLLRSRLDSVDKVALAHQDVAKEIKIDDVQESNERDRYFSGLKARVPPFVVEGLTEKQFLGHPISWHKKAGPETRISN